MSNIDYRDLREGDLVRATKTLATGSTATYEGRLVHFPANSTGLSIPGVAYLVGSISTIVNHPSWEVEVLEKAPDPELEAEAEELSHIINRIGGWSMAGTVVQAIQQAGYRKVSK